MTRMLTRGFWTKHRVPIMVLAVLVLTGAFVGLSQTFGSDAEADEPAVRVGSPVDGVWSTFESPAEHHWLSNAEDQGDWAVDIEAEAGTPVVLFAAAEDGTTAIKAKVDQIGASCRSGGGGSFVTVGIYTDDMTRIGSTTYAHIDPTVEVGQPLEPWAAELGTIGTYAEEADCWEGPHVHLQVFSETHYACWNPGYAPGGALATSDFVGLTGGNYAGEAYTACP